MNGSIIKNREDVNVMKPQKLRVALIVMVALIAVLVLGVGSAVVGSTKSALPPSLQVQHTWSLDTLQTGEPALGTLTLHNGSPDAIALDALGVQIAAGLTYVGQAFGSDVTGSAQVDGSALSWTGPFTLAAGETLVVRYWLVATDIAPGQYPSQAVLSVGGERLSVTGAPIVVESAPAPSEIEPLPASNSTAAPAAVEAVTTVKTANPTMAHPASAVLYTVVFANSANNSATLNAINDLLPVPFEYVGLAPTSQVTMEPVDTAEPGIGWQGSFTVPAAGTLTLRYWAWVPAGAEVRPTPYRNTVTATGSTSVGQAQADVTVAGPDIRLTKTAWPQEVLAGEPVTYTVIMENIGNADGVVDLISDTLPVGFVFEQMRPGGTITAPPTGTTGEIVWNGPFPMPAGSEKRLVYRVRTSTASGLEAPANEVVAFTDSQFTAPASAAVTVHPRLFYLPTVLQRYIAPYFVVTKTASPSPVGQGGSVTYSVKFTNPGSDPGVLNVISDTLPAGFTFQNMVSGPLGAPTGTTGTIHWHGPFTVGSGQDLLFSYRVQASSVPGTYQNRVTATALVGRAPSQPGVATVIVQPPTLLYEDFQTGTDGWEPFLNYWRLHPEQWYLQAGTGFGGSIGMRHSYFLGVTDPARGAHDALYMFRGNAQYPNPEQWTNYRVEAKVRLDQGTLIGLWVRGKYQPSTLDGLHVEGYYVQLRPARSDFTLQRIKTTGGTAYHFSDPEIIASGTYPMGLGNWHDLAVEVRGGNIKVFINGQQVLNHNDSTFLTGTVGLTAYSVAYGTWDNVLVTPLP
jgi:uncharacterized repeat protein (TIGR01451 family)